MERTFHFFPRLLFVLCGKRERGSETSRLPRSIYNYGRERGESFRKTHFQTSDVYPNQQWIRRRLVLLFDRCSATHARFIYPWHAVGTDSLGRLSVRRPSQWSLSESRPSLDRMKTFRRGTSQNIDYIRQKFTPLWWDIEKVVLLTNWQQTIEV